MAQGRVSHYYVENRLDDALKMVGAECVIKGGDKKTVTLDEIASFCGTSKVTIYNILNRKTKDVNLSTALRIAKLLEVPVEKIFFLKD